MRQVGDRLIPVGVSSGRVHALNPEDATPEIIEAAGGSRRRRRGGPHSHLDHLMGQDFEEVRSYQYLPAQYPISEFVDHDHGSHAPITY